MGRTVVGVKGRPRGLKGRQQRQDAVFDRGPKTLTGIEGDFVHSVGLMNAAYMFAVRSFTEALAAWIRREGITHEEAGARLGGIARPNVTRLLHGRFPPSHATMMKLRALMTGDQIPSSHDLPPQRHRR